MFRTKLFSRSFSISFCLLFTPSHHPTIQPTPLGYEFHGPPQMVAESTSFLLIFEMSDVFTPYRFSSPNFLQLCLTSRFTVPSSIFLVTLMGSTSIQSACPYQRCMPFLFNPLVCFWADQALLHPFFTGPPFGLYSPRHSSLRSFIPAWEGCFQRFQSFPPYDGDFTKEFSFLLSPLFFLTFSPTLAHNVPRHDSSFGSLSLIFS